MFTLVDENTLERKDVFVFVDEVNSRNFLLDDIPPKHGWNEGRLNVL